jgi:hypothetical protein
MADEAKEEKEEYKRSLCFDCSKACVRGCSWADDYTPVDGWTAEKTRLGYLVLKCPEFTPDGEDRGRPKSFDNEGVTNLLEAVMTQTRNDYITGNGLYSMQTSSKKYAKKRYWVSDNPKAANRRVIEKFLRSRYAKMMFFVEDPEKIITMLRRRASVYETQNMPK